MKQNYHQKISSTLNWTDALLLADMFEEFKNICHEIYTLNPVS